MATRRYSKMDVNVSATELSSTADFDKKREPPKSEKGVLATLREEDWWKWELIGVFGSALALVGIVIMLSKLNNKPLPSWASPQDYCVKVPKTSITKCYSSKGISVNSVISWFSTVAKICVLIPITKGLGQLKWVWFAEKQRTLADLETFDSATRGLTGSALLVWKLRGRHFAAIGAVAVILSLGFEPFIQNLVGYFPKNDVDLTSQALVSNASEYSTVGHLLGGNGFYVDSVMKANVYSSIISPAANQIWSQPHYVCPSGNCTFDPVASLGVIPICQDISSKLNMTCVPLVDTTSNDTSTADPSVTNCTVALPNGLASWFVNGGLNSVPFIIDNTHDTLVSDTSLASLSVVQSILAVGDTQSISNTTKFIATECTLPLLVASWNSSVGQVNQTSANVSPYQESLLKTWTNVIPDPLASNENYTGEILQMMIGPPVNPSLGVYTGQRFGLTLEALNSLRLFFGDIFSGYIRQASDNFIFNPTASSTGSSMDLLQAIYLNNFTNCANPEDKVTCAITNIGQAMSKTFRDAPYVSGGVQSANMAVGKTLIPVTYIKVTWYWIILPIFIWVLSVTTLLGTAWKSRRARVRTWRNNPQAMVFLQLGADENGQVKDMGMGMGDAGLSKKAEQLTVKLDVTSEGAMLTR